MRERQTGNEWIALGDALFAIAQRLPPGTSAIARALRDEGVWPNYVTFLSQWIEAQAVGAMLSAKPLIRWELESEQRARQDGSFRVGERHLPGQIEGSQWRELGINEQALYERVREFELGPALPLAVLGQMQHAFLDLSALIEYRQPDEIPWAEALGVGPVMVWLAGSVLNELDESKRSDRRRLRKRAQVRSRWVWERLDEALNDIGIEIRPSDGTRLKVWTQAVSGLRDTDHLEAALTLRSLGVDPVIVSDDTLMGSRGKLAGLRVVRLPHWRLEDDETA